MAPLLRVQGLTWAASETVLLEDVDLELNAGEIHALMGPSGSGKTSLLRLLVRLEDPSAGTVLVDGSDHTEMDPGTLRQRAGWVPQDPVFEPGTLWENAILGLEVTGRPIDEDRVEQILDRVGLLNLADRGIERLSAGEQQRLGLVRTVLLEPDILLLDEPTANLDSGLERRVETWLSDLASQGKGILLVTHAAAQAERLADRVSRLEDGQLTPAAAGAWEGSA